jgi:hypothetical protein
MLYQLSYGGLVIPDLLDHEKKLVCFWTACSFSATSGAFSLVFVACVGRVDQNMCGFEAINIQKLLYTLTPP